jgi:L-fucose isomerase-like protein
VSDVADDLRIKYGLDDNPSPAEVDQWVAATEALLEEGIAAEEAGRRAAAATFGQLERTLYFSEADTLAALLARAREK